jgi:hypothetical protein
LKGENQHLGFFVLKGPWVKIKKDFKDEIYQGFKKINRVIESLSGE